MIDRRWIILCVLFVARTAISFQFQSVGSVAPLLGQTLSVNYTEIGTLIGLFFLPGALISLPGGLFMQRFGDKRICAVGLSLMVAGGIVLGESHDFGMAFAGRLVSGTGAILLNQVLTKMTTDWFAGREIVFAMAVLLASWPFGIAAGLVIQPWMGASFGWPVVMYMVASLCGLALLLVALAYRTPVGASAPAEAFASAGVFVLPPRRQIMPLTVAGIIWGNANVGLVLFFSFMPQLLGEFGYSPVASASLPSTALWIIMLSVPLGGYITERLGEPDAAILLCCTFTALALALICLDISPPLLCAAFGVAMGPPAGALLALPARILGAKDRAAGLGLFFTWYYALMTLGPAIAGWLRDSWGTSATALQLASALFLTIAPLLLLFNRLIAIAPTAAGLPRTD
ncbi:MAG: MFS transporter [Hyphomicrobiales bacterium]